jgi:uncharacterized Tic20 family protein
VISATASRETERTWGALAHLSAFLGYFTGIGFWLGPLILWLVFLNRSKTVSDHAKEALNFHLSLLIYSLIVGASCFLLIGFVVLPFFIPVVIVVQLVMPIVAAIAAKDGEQYRYPLTLRLVQ